MFEGLCKHIEGDWAKKGKQGKPRVGFNFIDIGKYPMVYGKAAQLAAAKRGWDITLTSTSMEPEDVRQQVIQMNEFGSDYLYLMSTEVAAIAWLREMDSQKLHPTIYSVNGLSSRGAWDAVGELMVGSRLDHLIFQWTETEIPLVKLCHELNAKWHPGFEWRPNHYFRGFLVCLTLAEALERAITQVGYDNLDGSAMKEAMETIRDFKPEGTDVAFTWTPTDHQGLPTAVWYEWTEEGIQVPISERFGCDPLPEEMRTEAWWLE
jgi:branched-chain amino acid transport system substrate-binding protein